MMNLKMSGMACSSLGMMSARLWHTLINMGDGNRLLIGVGTCGVP